MGLPNPKLRNASYKLVKDVRSGYETSDVDGVMNGNLTPFLKAYLMNEGQGSADEMDDL